MVSSSEDQSILALSSIWMQPVIYCDASGCIVMQMQGEILAEISLARNHWWPIDDFQCDKSPDNILLGMWRLSTEIIHCMRSIKISWNRSSVFFRGKLRERQCGLLFLFKANLKVRTLSGRNEPMLTGSLASSSSSSILLHSRGLRQEDYFQDKQEDYIKTKLA